MIRISIRQANIILAVSLVISVLVLAWGTRHTYDDLPPIPENVTTTEGEVLYTHSDIKRGQAVFQKYNLMGYGTLLGNGSYFGPDYTAEYLDFLKERLIDRFGESRYGVEGDELGPERREAILVEVRGALDEVRYEDGTGFVPGAAADVHRDFVDFYRNRFTEGHPEIGVPAGTVPAGEVEDLAAFVGWTTWFSLLDRPGSNLSYTNNWPPDAELGMVPSSTTVGWTVWTIAIVLLITFVLITVNYFLELEPIEALPPLEERETGSLTFLQKLTVVLLFGCALIFFLQTLAGGYLANAYAGREDFYGLFELFGTTRLEVLPFRAVRTGHTAMAILWVVGTWMSATLYGALQIGGREKSWHKPVALGSVVLVTVSIVGTLLGVYASMQGWIGEYWSLIGTEGTEYLEMGRLWRWGIGIGFVIWFLILISVLKDAEVKWRPFLNLLLIIGGAITLFFFASFLYSSPESHWVLVDYWRWYVVHAWVEGVFAFFQLLVTGWFLAGVGLVDREEVTRSMYLEGFIIIFAGLLSVGHHFWWIGEPTLWISLGSIFGSLEVLPLFLLLISALQTVREAQTELETVHRVPFYLFVASAVWQFLGSAILGLLINPPLINYYEHGTFLTVAHAHAAFFGAFGFLALGMMIYAIRHAVPEGWSEWNLWAVFWTSNVGLFIMLAVSVIPIGVIQLNRVITESYAAARSVSFYQEDLILLLNELRLPGDTLIIIGALLLVWELTPKVYRLVSRSVLSR